MVTLGVPNIPEFVVIFDWISFDPAETFVKAPFLKGMTTRGV
jgi:hypothetical protein